MSPRDGVHAARVENIRTASGNVVALRNSSLDVGAYAIVGRAGGNGVGRRP